MKQTGTSILTYAIHLHICSAFRMDVLLKPGLCKKPSGEYRCCTDYKQVESRCIPCIGSFGINCTGGICHSGYYGFGCQKLCTCKGNEVCDPVVGCQAVEGNLWWTRLSIAEALAITFSVSFVLIVISVIIFKRKYSSRVPRTYVEERLPENALYHLYVDMENGYEKCEPGSKTNSNGEGKFTKDKNSDSKEEKIKTQKEKPGKFSSFLSRRQQAESDADIHSYISVVSSTEGSLSKDIKSSSTTKAIPTTPEGKPVASTQASNTGTDAKGTATLKTIVTSKRTSRITDTIHFFENSRNSENHD
ncbi:uncharacterized protein LOC125679401 isoform X3 [Ostrea edulis]|uniref:uncharacterized protein LOC125679401 isoform X3 n=1 Tax=Ostrea edulis TaxID=37623 RepID=UPI0024AF2EF2|nr:uncharacterized protein LOC125679401 isoform X3 [Ostrea edulis]